MKRNGILSRESFIKAAAVLLTVLVAVSMLLASQAPAFADTEDEEITYTIFIYSGKEGYFGSESNTMERIDGIPYGETVTISLSDYDLKVKDPESYYVR